MTNDDMRAARLKTLQGTAPVSTMRRLAVIGTAGRRKDTSRLSTAVFNRMCAAARAVVAARGITHLVSGGAAWADHVAVALVLDGTIPAANLTIHAPAHLTNTGYDESERDGGTCNHYHRQFSRQTGMNTLNQLAQVVHLGATPTVNHGGFKARNSDVARDGHIMLAFTFGTAAPWVAKVHKPGVTAAQAGLNPEGTGTVDTWTKSRAAERIHVSITALP